jgi:hypothetical protein
VAEDKTYVPRALIDRLRSKLRDFPETNELLDDEKESSDLQLARALISALNDWNTSTPILASQLITFDHLLNGDGNLKTGGGIRGGGITHLLIDKAICETLESVSISMMRNDFSFTSGNTSVDLNGRWKAYERMVARLESRYAESRDRIKGQINMEGAYGSHLHTEMFIGFHGAYAFLDVDELF